MKRLFNARGYGLLLFILLGALAGCTTPTKYPSDWKPTKPVTSAADVAGEYFDDCEMVHGKKRRDTDLAAQLGVVFEENHISKAVRIEPLNDKYLLLTFVQPFGEQRVVKLRYKVKQNWVQFGDYDVALRAEGGSTSGGAGAIAWLHGQRDNIYLRRDEDDNLIVFRTEREDLFFVFIEPIADEWYMRCERNPEVVMDMPTLRQIVLPKPKPPSGSGIDNGEVDPGDKKKVKEALPVL